MRVRGRGEGVRSEGVEEVRSQSEGVGRRREKR